MREPYDRCSTLSNRNLLAYTVLLEQAGGCALARDRLPSPVRIRLLAARRACRRPPDELRCTEQILEREFLPASVRVYGWRTRDGLPPSVRGRCAVFRCRLDHGGRRRSLAVLLGPHERLRGHRERGLNLLGRHLATGLPSGEARGATRWLRRREAPALVFGARGRVARHWRYGAGRRGGRLLLGMGHAAIDRDGGHLVGDGLEVFARIARGLGV